MATSIQRMLVMTIILNVLLISIGAYYAGTDDISQELVLYNNNLDDWHSNYSGSYGDEAVNTKTTILDNTFGNNKFGLGMIWDIFKGGITRVTTCQGIYEQNCTELEDYMFKGYWLAIALINILLVLEILFIVYTKKNS